MFYAIFYYVTLSFHFSFKLPIVHLNITDIHQHLRLFKGAVCNIQMINIAANSYLSQSCCINYNPNVSVLCWVASLAMRACYGMSPLLSLDFFCIHLFIVWKMCFHCTFLYVWISRVDTGYHQLTYQVNDSCHILQIFTTCQAFDHKSNIKIFYSKGDNLTCINSKLNPYVHCKECPRN